MQAESRKYLQSMGEHSCNSQMSEGIASFPDSTPQLFIVQCIKAGGGSLVHFVTLHASRRDIGCVVWCVVLLIRLRVTFIDVRRSKPFTACAFF